MTGAGARHCPVCGREFETSYGKQAYCSEACARRAARMSAGERHAARLAVFEPREFTCPVCGKVVEVTDPFDVRTRFCCAAHERKFWRDATRHPTHLTDYASAAEYFSRERSENRREAGL